MKKMGMTCMIAVCLITQNLSARMITLMNRYLNMSSEQEIERVREEFKDTVKVREIFEKGLLFYTYSDEVVRFKRKFGVSDEPMLTVVIEIIREESAKADKTKGGDYDDIYVIRALRWLGICADAKTKQFLWDIATDSTNSWDARAFSIEAYMRRADAQEVRNAIARFSEDDMRVKGKDGSPPIYLCVYDYTLQAYNEAEDDTQKREAIVASLSATLAKEENKKVFADLDKRLAEWNKEYADSPQRKALLERKNKPPEKETP